jgi:RNA polymerase sigma factor (sigma-70 family)
VTAEFPETRWSQLLELKDPGHPRFAEQMERLARDYWRPVYHYACALRPAEAEDLAQQFFATLLGRGDLARLSPERGSFRGFLKTALRNFVASAGRAAATRERFFRPEDAEWSDQGLSPEEAFDREWARGVLVEGVAALRRELEAAGKAGLFDLFREVCLDDREVSYEEAARARGLGTDDVRNRLRELRRRLREILRERLRDTLAPGEDVEAELRFVLSK